MSEEQAGAPEATEGERVAETKTETKSQIDNLEDALKVIDKLRNENASRRVSDKAKDQALADAAKKWQDYEDSQKTELQRLQEKAEQLENQLAKESHERLQMKVAAEYKLDPDLAEFVTGSDEEEMRSRAEKLAKRMTPEKLPTADLKAGDRGGPVGGARKGSAGGRFLLGLSD